MKASVIIAAFNAQETIANSIKSALDQTIRDLEIIVVDDASTDGTRDVVRDIMASDSRVTLLENAINLRVSATRNRGLDAANGAWIAILDADDRFAPSRLEQLIERAEESDVDMIGDNLLLVDAFSDVALGSAFDDYYENQVVTAEFMMQRDGPDSTTKRNFGYMKPLISRSFIDNNNLRYQEDVWVAEDFLFYFDCLLAGARFRLTPKPLYLHYTNNVGSLSSRTSVDREVSRVNRIMLERAKRSGFSHLVPMLKRRQQSLNYFAVVNAVKHSRYNEALRCLPSLPIGLAVAKVRYKLATKGQGPRTLD